MESVIECRNLTHYYGDKLIYKDLNFEVKKGRILGLLGKNGTGKTTTINILNGYLKPSDGVCTILGEPSHSLSPQVKARIGFLIEGHIQHAYMNIHQIERYYSKFFPHWKREAYWDLMSKLKVTAKQKISTMSCGQRSQVALGLILAQDPDLMILDDFSMGLDPGYRRLFIDYLRAYAQGEDKTIFITSHIIQDMEDLIDDCMIMDYGKLLLSKPTDEFLASFHHYRCDVASFDSSCLKQPIIENYDLIKNQLSLFSFASQSEIEGLLKRGGIEYHRMEMVPMSLEDAFIGLTGKY